MGRGRRLQKAGRARQERDRKDPGGRTARECGQMGKRAVYKMTAAVILACLTMSLAGCADQLSEEDKSGDRLKIVCTVFPEYDWVRQILGEHAEDAELTLLMKNGADLHSYQPTVWDIRKIAEADLFLYVGGESDFWVEEVLAGAPDPERKVLNLMEILEESVQEEEHVEGMQAERGHDDDPEPPESHPDTGGSCSIHDHADGEYDEHVWLSLRNAGAVCDAVTEALGSLKEEHADSYIKNNEIYQEKLHALDLRYVQAVEAAPSPVFLFGDRFPFLYLTKDYGIAYYAAFAGCSAETEASFATIAFLADKAGELALPAVLAMDGSDQKIARTIAENTDTRDQKVLVLDSMQSVSEADIREGTDYLSIMEKNLTVLEEALGIQGGM